MGDGGGYFPQSRRRELCKHRSGDTSTDICKGISVEKEEWGTSMAAFKKVECFTQGQLTSLLFAPLCFDRWVSL